MTDIVFCFIGTRHTAHLESFLQFNLKINDNKKMLLLTINLELEICKKVDLSYII